MRQRQGLCLVMSSLSSFPVTLVVFDLFAQVHGHSTTSIGISGTQEEMVEVITELMIQMRIEERNATRPVM